MSKNVVLRMLCFPILCMCFGSNSFSLMNVVSSAEMARPRSASGECYNPLKIYVGGVWVNLRGQDIVPIIKECGVEPVSAWVIRG